MGGAIKGDERDRELVPIQVRVVGHVEHLDVAWRAFGPDEGRNQRSSEVIRGHQRSSVVISGHGARSDGMRSAISGHRERRSDAIIDQQLYSAGQ